MESNDFSLIVGQPPTIQDTGVLFWGLNHGTSGPHCLLPAILILDLSAAVSSSTSRSTSQISTDSVYLKRCGWFRCSGTQPRSPK
jgi:hypothetical protein